MQQGLYQLSQLPNSLFDFYTRQKETGKYKPSMESIVGKGIVHVQILPEILGSKPKPGKLNNIQKRLRIDPATCSPKAN